jgi:DNA-binding CsgD family transcriptional regulator
MPKPHDDRVRRARRKSGSESDVASEHWRQFARFLALSQREEEVARLWRDGWKIRAIARQLEIDERTVRTHKEHVYAKMNAHSRAEFVEAWYLYLQSLQGDAADTPPITERLRICPTAELQWVQLIPQQGCQAASFKVNG